MKNALRGIVPFLLVFALGLFPFALGGEALALDPEEGAATPPAQANGGAESGHIDLAAAVSLLAGQSDGGTVLATEAEGEVIDISSWDTLKSALTTGGSFRLAEDIAAENGADPLIVPADTEVVLDLNGKTLKRSETGQIEYSVITNRGTLTVKDSVGGGTITGGNTRANGGGINIEEKSTCIIEGGKVEGNHADYGGGIYNAGTLTINGGDVSANEAFDEGGGIYGKGTTKLSNCTIWGNTADYGGGIYFDKKPNEQTLDNVTIGGNTAKKQGAAIYLQTGTVTMTGGAITQSVSFDGAGVYVTDNTTFTADGTSFTSNTVKDVSGYEETLGKSGGALVNHGTSTLRNCTVEGNKADQNSGAIWSDENLILHTTTVANNTLRLGNGGGIYIKSGTAQMVACTISGNTTGGSSYRDEDDCDGGGIANNGTLTLDGCTITGNRARTNGGGIYNTGTVNVTGKTTGITNNTTANGAGGGVCVKSGTAEFNGANITGNTAKTAGGGIDCMSNGKIVFSQSNEITGNKTGDSNRVGGEGGGVYMDGKMTANIILKDGATLSALNGIVVEGGDALTVWGQDEGTGKLKATNWGNNAAIGSRSGKKAGTMTLNGGVVEAVSGYGAAAIGAGTKANGGTVVINYGSVSAIADGPGAGIGCGAYTDYVNPREPRSNIENGGTVTINGGTVYAAVDNYSVFAFGGAGIGGGEYCDGANVTITGGTVTAIGGNLGGAGIGGGYWSEGRTCTVTGGHVTATSKNAYGVGNGAYVRSKGTAKTILDYNDTDMSFTASSYSAGDYKRGTLTLAKPFKNADNPSQIYGAAVDLDSENYKLIYSLDGVTLVPAPDAHTVTFDTDGADKVTPQGVEDGACAQEPAKPYKKGFRFIGWRVVEGSQMSPTDFDFSTPITGDVLLKAFFIDEKETSGDPYEIETLGDVPEIDSPNMADVVTAVLTKDELDTGYFLLLASSPLAESDVPSADKAALDSLAIATGILFACGALALVAGGVALRRKGE